MSICGHLKRGPCRFVPDNDDVCIGSLEGRITLLRCERPRMRRCALRGRSVHPAVKGTAHSVRYEIELMSSWAGCCCVHVVFPVLARGEKKTYWKFDRTFQPKNPEPTAEHTTHHKCTVQPSVWPWLGLLGSTRLHTPGFYAANRT